MADRLPAFEVDVDGYTCIVFAETASQAKWTAVSGYWDAYGRSRNWPWTKCHREPLYDSNPLATHGRKGYAPSFVRSYP
jgi:hypothetical protein